MHFGDLSVGCFWRLGKKSGCFEFWSTSLPRLVISDRFAHMQTPFLHFSPVIEHTEVETVTQHSACYTCCCREATFPNIFYTIPVKTSVELSICFRTNLQVLNLNTCFVFSFFGQLRHASCWHKNT